MRRSLSAVAIVVVVASSTFSFSAESPPATCQGTETFRFRVQVSLNGGSTWLNDSATMCMFGGTTKDLAVRTLMTVTSGQTQGWSFSLKHNAP